MRKEENTNLLPDGSSHSAIRLTGLLKRRREPALHDYRYAPERCDNTLRFHLFDNTRRTVIADAELTLNAGNGTLTLLGDEINGLIE